MLHDDDGFLQRVLLLHLYDGKLEGKKSGTSTCLSLQLLHNGLVDCEWILFCRDGHGSVVYIANCACKVGNSLSGHLTLSRDRSRELASVVLYILEMCLDLGAEFLKVLHYGRLDGPGQRCVRVGDEPSLIADGVEDIL